MKILVTVKRVPDPEQKVKFKGTSVDVSAANWVINAFDEYAIEAALRLNENAATGEKLGETIALSIGPKDVSQQLRSALAMGADRAIQVGGADEELDSFAVARIVKAVVEREKPDQLLMGKLATDGEASQVPQLCAALLDWPQATFAAQITANAEGLEVKREVDTGIEVKQVKLPAVVSVDLRIEDDPVDFARHNLDLRVSYGAGPYADLVVLPLAQDAVLPLCTPETWARLGGAGLAGLPDAALIHTHWGPSYASHPTWGEWFAAAGLPRQPKVAAGPRASHSSLALDLALAGAGVALGQRLLAAGELAAGRLLAPDPRPLPLGQPYCLVHPHRKAGRPGLQSLLQALTAG